MTMEGWMLSCDQKEFSLFMDKGRLQLSFYIDFKNIEKPYETEVFQLPTLL